MFEKWKNHWKIKRLKKLLEKYPNAETIPYHEVVKAVGKDLADTANPFLSFTETEPDKKINTDRHFKPQKERSLVLSKKPYVINKTRQQGEEDLFLLAKTETYEGAWLFCHDTHEWFNLTTGYFKKITSKEIVFGVKQNLIDISNIGDRFTHYHIHTRKAMEAYKKMTKKDFYNNPSNKVIFSSELEIDLGISDYISRFISMPSPLDMTSAAQLRNNYSNANVDFVIISPLGCSLTTINLIPKKTKLDDTNTIESTLNIYKNFFHGRPSIQDYLVSDRYTDYNDYWIIDNIAEHLNSKSCGFYNIIDLGKLAKKGMEEGTKMYLEQSIADNHNSSKTQTNKMQKIKEWNQANIQGALDLLEPVVGTEHGRYLAEKLTSLIGHEFAQTLFKR